MIRIKNTYIGKKIRITYCWCKAPLYDKFTPGSIHTIIKPPGLTYNSEKGVWVQGNGEPAYLQNDEYKFITLKRTK